MKTETDHPNTGKERYKREQHRGNGEYLRKSSKTKEKLGKLGRPPRPDAGNVLCTIVFNSTSRTHARKRKQGKARKEKARKEGQTEKARKRNQGKKENASKRKKGKGSSEKRGK